MERDDRGAKEREGGNDTEVANLVCGTKGLEEWMDATNNARTQRTENCPVLCRSETRIPLRTVGSFFP